MNWIRIKDALPQIPIHKYGVSVIVAYFDPCYDEMNPNYGYDISTCNYHNNKFMELSSDGDWYEVANTITHWMYFPETPKYDPEVLNPIFKHYHETAKPQSPLKVI